MHTQFKPFARNLMESLSPDERRVLLEELETLMLSLLSHHTDHQTYYLAVDEIIEALRVEGHDLYGEYDGEDWTWGGNYMDKETQDPLVIQFKFPPRLHVHWNQERFDPLWGTE